MVSLKRKKLFFWVLFMIIHLPFSWCSSTLREAVVLPTISHHKKDHNPSQLNKKMIYEVTVHGLLLWASLGLLMPMGILIIRMSNKEQSGIRLKVYFYLHLIIQMVTLCVATTGAIKSIKTFENSFNNTHQRLGLVLYCAIWVQAVIGCCRPHRGTKKRSLWYFLHWIFGTIVCIVGILNIYTGLQAYKQRTNKSVTLWGVLFTAQISSMAFIYLFQDKWDYLQKQGVCSREGGQIRPSIEEDNNSQRSNNENNNNNKDLWREPCSKVNALKNLFK